MLDLTEASGLLQFNQVLFIHLFESEILDLRNVDSVELVFRENSALNLDTIYTNLKLKITYQQLGIDLLYDSFALFLAEYISNHADELRSVFLIDFFGRKLVNSYNFNR
jgi:hypothetical protein